MGCGWPGQDPTPLETLLPEHTGMDVTAPVARDNPEKRLRKGKLILILINLLNFLWSNLGPHLRGGQ